jgi:hypothetical protein
MEREEQVPIEKVRNDQTLKDQSRSFNKLSSVDIGALLEGLL